MLHAIITNEIIENYRRAETELIKARRALNVAEDTHLAALKMLQCDRNDAHNFSDGGGGLGGPFIETCTNCGWNHTA